MTACRANNFSFAIVNVLYVYTAQMHKMFEFCMVNNKLLFSEIKNFMAYV